MNPNNVNHFASTATNITRSRSRFFRPSSLKTTFNSGSVVPVYVSEVLPGDTFSMKVGAVVRGSTPLVPVMDNAYNDIMFFFVPNRLIWQDFKAFMGENDQPDSYWVNPNTYTVPQVNIPGNSSIYPMVGSLADYMGAWSPSIGSGSSVEVAVLRFRAYVKIWNDWFRDENTQPPAHLYLDSVDRNFTSETLKNPIVGAELGGALLPANKYKDYFTSGLPGPLKSLNPVLIPLGTEAPVMAKTIGTTPTQGLHNMGGPLRFSISGTTTVVDTNLGLDGSSGNVTVFSGSPGTKTNPIQYSNMYADLSSATAASINQLRLAFQIQKYYETQARAGTRYTEILLGLFSVQASDARLQRSEYLGGKRVPITMQQVAQTSASVSDGSPLGATGAVSQTSFSKFLFEKSFEEHGVLIGVSCVRTDQLYQYGINREWFRKTVFDYYFPVFANLGERPIFNKEIYAQGTSVDDEAFAYQEAWAEYRYKQSMATGYMRSLGNETGANGSLDFWHYGEVYSSLPMLNSFFIQQSVSNIDKTLAVPVSDNEDAHQFFADYYFEEYAIRIMPMYSVPGLIDHH